MVHLPSSGLAPDLGSIAIELAEDRYLLPPAGNFYISEPPLPAGNRPLVATH